MKSFLWITLVVLAVNLQNFLSPNVIGGYDNIQLYYSYGEAIHRIWREGLSLIWTDRVCGGVPLLANIEMAVFHPLTAFYLLNDVVLAQKILLVVAHLVGCFGFFAFFKKEGSDDNHAIAASLAIGLSGFWIGHRENIPYWLSGAEVGWLFWSLSSLKKAVSIRYVGAFGLSFGLMILGGCPQLVIMTGIICAIYLFVFLKKYSLKGMLFIFIGLILGIAIASPQIAATKEFISETYRDFLSWEERSEYYLKPWYLLLQLHPYVLGAYNHPIFGAGFHVYGHHHEVNNYISLGLLTYLFASRKLREMHLLTKCLVFTGIAMAIGRYSPLYMFAQYLPFFTQLRVPIRWMFLVIVGVAYELSRTKTFTNQEPRRTDFRLIFILASMVVLISLFPFFAKVLSLPESLKNYWNNHQVGIFFYGIFQLSIFAAILKNRTNFSRVLTIIIVDLIVFGGAYSIPWTKRPPRVPETSDIFQRTIAKDDERNFLTGWGALVEGKPVANCPASSLVPKNNFSLFGQHILNPVGDDVAKMWNIDRAGIGSGCGPVFQVDENGVCHPITGFVREARNSRLQFAEHWIFKEPVTDIVISRRYSPLLRSEDAEIKEGPFSLVRLKADQKREIEIFYKPKGVYMFVLVSILALLISGVMIFFKPSGLRKR